MSIGSVGPHATARAAGLLGVAAVLVGVAALAPACSAQARQRGAADAAWKVELTPNLDRSSTGINLLSAVSCTSRRACTAVGSYEASLSSPSFPLVEEWKGTSWRVQRTVVPKGASGGELHGVSCTSATACSAVGYAFEKTGHGSVGLAEAWNGTSWRIQAVPNPKGSADASLLAVSCSSPGACTAVGFSANSAGQLALAERWNGRSWRIQRLPAPGRTELYGVSCPAAHACIAVGHDTRAGRPFAESWNGTTWRVLAVPLPHGSSGGTFAAVSCTSPRACTATGGDFGSGRPTLAERWNGARWAVQATSNPTDVSASQQEPELNGVSCSSSDACAATGAYAPGGRSAYFLEVWNGTSWQLVGPIQPAGFRSGALNGVSCVPSRCTSVGAWSGGLISIATLALAT